MIARLVWASKLVEQHGRCHVDLATLRVRDPKNNLQKDLLTQKLHGKKVGQ